MQGMSYRIAYLGRRAMYKVPPYLLKHFRCTRTPNAFRGALRRDGLRCCALELRYSTLHSTPHFVLYSRFHNTAKISRFMSRPRQIRSRSVETRDELSKILKSQSTNLISEGSAVGPGVCMPSVGSMRSGAGVPVPLRCFNLAQDPSGHTHSSRQELLHCIIIRWRAKHRIQVWK